MNNIGGETATFLIIPGTSDYPTGGYVITGLMCRMPKGIFAVSVDGQNSTGAAIGYSPLPTLGFTLASNNIPNIPSQFALQFWWSSVTITGGAAGTVAIGISSDANGAALSKTTATNRTGITGVVTTEAPASTNLSGGIWVITVTGY